MFKMLNYEILAKINKWTLSFKYVKLGLQSFDLDFLICYIK